MKEKEINKVVSVSSLLCAGVASLKIFEHFLGNHLIMAPSVIYTTYASFPGCKKLPVDLAQMLDSIGAMMEARSLNVALHIGFLANETQVDILEKFILNNRKFIGKIIIDPVCGDHGRLYVTKEIVKAWVRLLPYADIAFPNAYEFEQLKDAGLSVLPQKTVITSFEANGQIGIKVKEANKEFEIMHKKVASKMGGTGDMLAACFIGYHYFLEDNFKTALEKAAWQTLRSIEESILSGSSELLLGHVNYLKQSFVKDSIITE